MRKCVIIILLGTTGILVGPARAAIVNIDCGLWPEGHTFSWSFDYELQKLTISQTIYYLAYDLDPDPWWTYGTSSFGIGGRVDDPYSDSTFDVDLTITNETGVEWIGYKFVHGPLGRLGAGAYIIPGSIETTKLQTITDTTSGWLLSEPPAVFDGESFTMNFDMRTSGTAHSKGRFGYGVYQIPVFVPEPGTIVLFGVGGLALLKKHKP